MRSCQLRSAVHFVVKLVSGCPKTRQNEICLVENRLGVGKTKGSPFFQGIYTPGDSREAPRPLSPEMLAAIEWNLASSEVRGASLEFHTSLHLTGHPLLGCFGWCEREAPGKKRPEGATHFCSIISVAPQNHWDPRNMAAK